MKHQPNKGPLTPAGANQNSPLRPAGSAPWKPGQPSILVVRTERRSWMMVAISAFGAVLLRYLKTVRERGFRTQPGERQKAANRKQN